MLYGTEVYTVSLVVFHKFPHCHCFVFRNSSSSDCFTFFETSLTKRLQSICTSVLPHCFCYFGKTMAPDIYNNWRQISDNFVGQ